MAPDLDLPAWPRGASVAVSLTFDVDAESPWLAESDRYTRRLSTLSAGRFGITRGLPRLLDLLDRLSVPATFYVPGATAQRHPHAVRAIAGAGHEVGHHGHRHLRSDLASPDEQRQEIDRGLRALEDCVGARPLGYRSPAWELTPETFALIVDRGFEYDSSCMGDDRPYLEEHGGATILELPVHWSLDDWPLFGWTLDRGGVLTDPRAWVHTWLEELDQAAADRRHVTFTMHPEVVGRGYRYAALARMLTDMRSRGWVWFETHRGIADLLRSGSR